MKNCNEILLSLLTCAVRGEALPPDLLSQISDEEIKEIYDLSKKHDLAHLCGAALETIAVQEKSRYKPFFAEAVKAAYMGDNQFVPEYGISHDQMIGVVTSFIHNGTEYPTTCLLYKVYGRFWCASRPFRQVFVKIRNVCRINKDKRKYES